MSSSVETASLPERQIRRQERSAGSRSWSWIRAESAAGIIASTVGRCSRRSGSSSWLSKVRATTTRPPTLSVLSAQRNEPMCDIDEPGRNRSSAVRPNAARALAIIQRSDSWVWVTPFAGPVEPEVKKMAAGSPGLGAGRRGRRPVARRLDQVLEPRQLVVLGRVGDVPREAGHELARGEILGPLGVGDDPDGAADREGVVDLAVRVAVVERDGDEAGAEAGQVVDQQGRPVRHQRRKPVPALELGGVGRGERGGPRLQLLPAELVLSRDDRHGSRLGGEPRVEQALERRCRLQGCHRGAHQPGTSRGAAITASSVVPICRLIEAPSAWTKASR